MKKEEIGDIALRDFKKVKYFPFENSAAAPYILTSDPLGYLEAWIDNWYDSIQRDKSHWREPLEKARYFSQLSKDFYNSARNARMPSKGTLIYYSFINLVKVYLIIKEYELETKMEHHGLTLPSDKETSLKLSKPDEGISIFHEFAKCIHEEIDHSAGLFLELPDLLRNLPEVHEIGYALDLFPETKRKFLPVEIDIRTNSMRNKLFYTISYDKKFDDMMRVEKLKKNHLKDLIEPFDVEDDNVNKYFKSKSQFTYTTTSERSWKMCYPKITADIQKLNLTPMLTRQGYRYYLDLEPYRLHRLSSLLAFAFYIGTVARYRPTLNENILKGKYQTIINEAIISCPNQFFYLMVSHITNQICAIPKAKIE